MGGAAAPAGSPDPAAEQDEHDQVRHFGPGFGNPGRAQSERRYVFMLLLAFEPPFWRPASQDAIALGQSRLGRP